MQKMQLNFLYEEDSEYYIKILNNSRPRTANAMKELKNFIMYKNILFSLFSSFNKNSIPLSKILENDSISKSYMIACIRYLDYIKSVKYDNDKITRLNDNIFEVNYLLPYAEKCIFTLEDEYVNKILENKKKLKKYRHRSLRKSREMVMSIELISNKILHILDVAEELLNVVIKNVDNKILKLLVENLLDVVMEKKKVYIESELTNDKIYLFINKYTMFEKYYYGCKSKILNFK